MKKMWVYILECGDGSYYVGVTNNIRRRLTEHWSRKNAGSYVAKRLPFNLVFLKEFTGPKRAIAFEKQLKGWSRKKKEALIEGYTQSLNELAACKNGTHHAHYTRTLANPGQPSP